MAAASPVAPVVEKKHSTISSRLSAFVFGVAVTAITFSYFVRQDVQLSAIEMRRTIDCTCLCAAGY